MRATHAVRASVVTYGQAKAKCDSTGRPTGDRPASFATLRKALCSIGIPETHVHHLPIQGHAPPGHDAASHLEQSDVVVLACEGPGSLEAMREALRTTWLDEAIQYRHTRGACILAVGEAVNLLGAICPVGRGPRERVPGLGLCPFMLCLAAQEDHAAHLRATMLESVRGGRTEVPPPSRPRAPSTPELPGGRSTQASPCGPTPR